VSHTALASVFEGAVLPEDGFVNEEAMAVSGMTEELKKAITIGALTHLNPDLTSVQDPTTLLIMLPPVEANKQKQKNHLAHSKYSRSLIFLR
jgi:hypothetical protein